MTRADPVAEVGERIDRLLDEIEQVADPDVSARAEELVRSLVELYGEGLTRILDAVRAGDGGEDVVARLAADPVVAGLLVVHGLHPTPLEQRVHDALEQVRPYLGSHAGGVEYLGLDEATARVQLRLQGSCESCPSSTVTVAMAIEQAVMAAAPEIAGLDVEGMVDLGEASSGPPAQTGTLLQIQPFDSGRHPAASSGWVEIAFGPLLPGQTTGLVIDGAAVLVCSAVGSVYAYRDSCAHCSTSLEHAQLSGATLSCAECGNTFDVQHAGRGISDPTLHLEPMPLLPEQGGWKIAIPEGVVR